MMCLLIASHLIASTANGSTYSQAVYAPCPVDEHVQISTEKPDTGPRAKDCVANPKLKGCGNG